MPRASHKGALSVGVLHVPVELYTATQDNDIKFNQLCREDGSRINYKKVCSKCGKEVKNEDIVKGFEFEPGQYITMTEDDFERAKTEKDKNIVIQHFTDLANVRPIYYDKTYHIIPQKGSEKAYSLLQQAMKDEGKIAIAKTVIGNAEKLVAVIPTNDGMLAVTLFFADEVKAIPKSVPKLESSDAELNMAKSLISAMDKEFEPELYHDEYQVRLMEIIQQKIEGKEIVAPEENTTITVVNLMEALQQSLEQAKKPKKGGRKKVASSKA